MNKIKKLYFQYDVWLMTNQGWGWFLTIIAIYVIGFISVLLFAYALKIFY